MIATDLRQLKVVLVGDAKSAVNALNETGAAADGQASKLGRFGQFGKLAFEAVGAAAFAVGAISVKAASTFEDSQARLKTSIKDVGGTFKDAAPAVDALNKRFEKFGDNAATTDEALSRLVSATKNPTKAINDMSLAANIAAARHSDLGSATDLLVKVESGHYTQLARLGLATKDQIKGFKNSQDALSFLSNTYKGQAAAAADTFGGKVNALKAQLTDLAVKIGLVLIPIIETLSSTIVNVINWFEQHKTVALFLATVIGGPLVVAIGIYTASLIAAAVTTASILIPILAIPIAIGVLIAAIVLLAANWHQVWSDIKQWAGDAWHWIDNNVVHPIAHAFDDAITWYLAPYVAAWKAIKDTALAAWHWIDSNVIGPIKSAFNAVSSAVKAITGAGGKPLTKAQEDALIKGAQGPFTSGRATGGFLDPGWNLVGEEGPELIGPNRMVYTAGQTQSMLGGNGGNIIINVAGSVISEKELGQIAWRELLTIKRLNGTTGLT